MAAKHTHYFVEENQESVAYGFDRKTDERTLTVYLQKFSDDALLKTLLPRLAQSEMDALFDMVSSLLRNHISEPEYHDLFLRLE